MRWQTTLVAATMLASALAGCIGGTSDERESGPPAAAAVTSWVNGEVWTGDPARPEAQALVVENSTLVFVGTTDTARSMFPQAIERDLGGRRVVPGLIDSHAHFVRVAAGWDCDAATNPFSPAFDASQQALAEYEASRAQIAAGHHQTNASGKTPVDDATPIASRTAAKAGLDCAMREAAAMGLTMVVEAGVSSWDFIEVLQEMEGADALTLRFSLYLTPPTLDRAIAEGVTNGWGSDWVRVAGIKYYSDGWLGPRTSALLAPYSDRPGQRGVLFLEQPEANDWVSRAADAGLKPATHTIGDQGVTVMLNAYEQAQAALGPGQPGRFTFEHAQVLGPRLVERIAALGGIVSFQLSFATTDQRFAEDALGPQRVAQAYLWNTLDEAGVVIAGGSDFPIEVLPPLWGLQRVVTRQELDGTPPGGWFADEALSMGQALRSVTYNAAYTVWMEDRVGTLSPGYLADFVVLDGDIVDGDASAVAATCVWLTVVGGGVAYDRTIEDRCPQVAYSGQLVARDKTTTDLLEARLRLEAMTGTRLTP